jgi:integrase
MASINPRKDRDGITIGWQAQVRRKGYPAQSKTFEKKSQAQAWARQVESEVERGVFVSRGEAERTTLCECLERYQREITPSKKPSGQGPERGFIRQWMQRPIARRIIAEIRGVDVAAAVKEMEGEGKSANTIRLHLAVLSHLFTVAQGDWGMESLDNPVARVRKPRLPKGRERRVREGEMGALIGAADLRLACLIVLTVETAMRREELASLIWENVDLKARSLFLPKTKNGEARTVPLSPGALESLTTLPRNLSGSVFGLSADGIDSAWGRARTLAGIAGGWGDDALHLHDLRHEATSRFFERTDLDLMEICTITGHKSLQMLSRYTHLRTVNLVERLAGAKRGNR